MANNIIQVKRTSTSGRTPNTTGSYGTNSQYIAAGEFALNMADGILYTSNGSAVITVGSNLVNQRITNSVSIDNAKRLNFTTINTSAAAYFTQQNDDNFVFYSTNTGYGARAVWGVFANSITSNLQVYIPLQLNSGLVANSSLGSAGQVLTSNGTTTYWSTVGGSGTVTSVATGNGMTGGPVTTTGTVSILANTGIVANATGTFVNSSYIATIAANSATYLGDAANFGNSSGINAASFTAGAIGTGTGGSVQNTTTMFVGNNTINTTHNSSAFSITGNATLLSTVTLTGSGLVAGNGTTTNTGMLITVANSISNTQITPALVSVANSISNTQLSRASLFVGNATVNATVNSSSYSVAGNTTTLPTAVLSATGLVIGNSSTTTTTAITLSVANSITNSQLTQSSLFVGNATVNSVHNSSAFSITGNATLLSTVTLSGTGLVAGNSTTTNTGMSISVANSVGNVQITPISMRVANATVSAFTANTTQVTIAAGVPLSANGGVGSAAQVLTSNGATGSPYWSTVSGGSSNIQVQNTSISTPNNGVLYWNSDLGKILIYYTDGTSNQFVEAALSGIPGPQGLTGTINVGTTTTLSPGVSATVNNSGNTTAAILDFGVPRGTTIAVNTSVTAGSPGSTPSITVTSNATFDNVINFTLSTGAVGPTAPKSITIPSPAAGDTYTLFWTNAAITLQEIRSVVQGTTPSVDATFSWGNNRSSGVTIQANVVTSNVTLGNSLTAFTNSTPAANSFLWITINNVTGTVTEYHATLRF